MSKTRHVPEPLPTEARNPASESIDAMSTLDMLTVIHYADRSVAQAITHELPAIAHALDQIVLRMRRGGRLIYIGAGTSGRLGVLDASECQPTYNVGPETVLAIMAGGDHALRFAIEDVEDDPDEGSADLSRHNLTENDSVIGIAASGSTPYVLGALRFARENGALTIALTCVHPSPLAETAELAITPVTGPEVVTGSTRMKAGTATKMVLNMLSTGTMIQLGHVYGNQMVDMQLTNSKLRARARRIIASIAGIAEDQADALLKQAGAIKTAIVMHKLGCSRLQAEAALAAHSGHLRHTLAARSPQPPR